MEKNNILLLIKQKIGMIILSGVFVAALSFLFLVVSQKSVKVGTDFLVVQDKDGGQDYYALAKSAEYISKIMSEAVYSDLFIDETINTGKISKEFLPFDKKARLHEWSRVVRIKRNPEVSMISVTVYGNNVQDAVNISEGITEVFSTKSYLFRGSGLNVDVRKISGPIVEKNPSISQLALVMVGGFIVGMLLAAAFFYYRPKKDVNVFPDEDEYLERLKYFEKQ
jgi:capsular polysaccharide biosynthesis protein